MKITLRDVEFLLLQFSVVAAVVVIVE